MELIVIASSSKGNSYILDSGNSILLIEVGVSYKTKILPGCGHRRKDIVGCLVTHHHNDHASHISELRENGIKCYTPSDLEGIHHRQEYVEIGGGFGYMALKMVHTNGDCSPCECWAFLIHHKDSGWILFCTDTAYIPQDISLFELSHVLIAANYSKDILVSNVKDGTINMRRAKHTIKGHMSIERCIKELSMMNLTKCHTITLLHLSESNSAADEFKTMIEREFGIQCDIAESGLMVDCSKEPF